MLTSPPRALLAIAAAIAFAAPASAQTFGSIARDGDNGRMTMADENTGAGPVVEALSFRPYETIDELAREDVVLLMRHGKTDWSKRDASNVAPTDCENQRVMTEDGKREMFELGALLVANDLRPGRIVVSQWCRNQETLEAMRAGMEAVDPNALDGVPIDTMADLNLLLSLQGAPDVAAMRTFISDWDGELEDGPAGGPLLIISHFTNIQELTERTVYEGEMLLLDPDQENRVVGQVLLESAGPDVGHFQ